MDIAELIDFTLGKIHPCTCDPAYTQRRDRGGRPLVDPSCIYHEVVGDGEEIVKVLREYGHLDPLEAHRFNEPEPPHVTVGDLFRLCYQTGNVVQISVDGGRETMSRITVDGMSYLIPEDEDELLRLIDFKTKPTPPFPPRGIRR
jgi:hypothetical protein